MSTTETELDRAILSPDPAATIQLKIDEPILPQKEGALRRRLGGPLETQWGKDENISPALQNLLTIATLQALPRFAASAGARPHTAHLRNAHLQKHDKPLGADPFQSSNITDVAVDGSHKEKTSQTPAKTAGGVAYLVKYPDGRREIHMTNAVRKGDKGALDSELTAATLSLRLKSLHNQQTLTTSWDCQNPLRHLWHSNPTCKPATNADTQPQHQSADKIATPSRQSQLRRISELLARNTVPGTTNTFKHQKAHGADPHLRPLITNPTEDTVNQVYIIELIKTEALVAKATEIQAAPTAGAASTSTYDPIHVTLNVCADWAARQVAVEGQTPFHDLGPCAWPPAWYSATDKDGNFIDHTPSSIRRAVTEETGNLALHAHTQKDPFPLQCESGLTRGSA
ncbi:hypothetical protein T492DRAFT_1126364 [Pavlovales sp. CCMP2436]|nr:hypothetical protein T492DRAFT_1126364 [Pavlovales sp. CCMP2436]